MCHQNNFLTHSTTQKVLLAKRNVYACVHMLLVCEMTILPLLRCLVILWARMIRQLVSSFIPHPLSFCLLSPTHEPLIGGGEGGGDDRGGRIVSESNYEGYDMMMG